MIFARFSRSASACRAMARFMLSGRLDVLELDDGHLDAPLLGLDVEDLADVLVDLVRLGQGLVEGVTAHDGAERGLGDLVDGRSDVLDRDDGADRIVDAVVRDGGDVDADVVAGDDPLGLDRHRDDAQRDAVDAIDERDDEDHAGAAGAVLDAPQPELHAPLVLLEDLQAGEQAYEHAGGERDYDVDDGHGGVLLAGCSGAELREVPSAARSRAPAGHVWAVGMPVPVGLPAGLPRG